MSGEHGMELSGNFRRRQGCSRRCAQPLLNGFVFAQALDLSLQAPHSTRQTLKCSSILPRSPFFFLQEVFEMASRIVIKRFTSQLPKWDSLLNEQVKPCAPARAFGATAAKAQNDSTVEVGRTSGTEHAPAVSGQSRGWPRSMFPGLFSPFYQPTSLTQMMDTMDRLFDFPVLAGSQPLTRNTTTRMPWDVVEDEKSFKLRVDMPGMSKEDVKVCVEDGELIIKAEYDANKKEDDWSSRSYGSYNVRIKLPENVDASGIKAEMKDGVLKVQALKVEGARQKHEVQIE